MPAHTDEHEAAEAVLTAVSEDDILANKGCIGYEWRADISRTTENWVLTVKRDNQHEQNPPLSHGC